MKLRIISSILLAASTIIVGVIATEKVEVLDKTIQHSLSLDTDSDAASRDLELSGYPRENSSVQSRSSECNPNWNKRYINKVKPNGAIITKTCHWLYNRPHLHHAKCTMQSHSDFFFSVAKDVCHTICEQYDHYLVKVNDDHSYESRSCLWLFKNQHLLHDHCTRDMQGIGGLLPAKDTCRILCGTCSESCAEDPNASYLVKLVHGVPRIKTCRWLSRRPAKIHAHCAKTHSYYGYHPAKIVCPDTCSGKSCH